MTEVQKLHEEEESTSPRQPTLLRVIDRVRHDEMVDAGRVLTGRKHKIPYGARGSETVTRLGIFYIREFERIVDGEVVQKPVAKFRTMKRGADKEYDQARQTVGMSATGQIAAEDDDRVEHWIQALLRNTKLDELPQLGQYGVQKIVFAFRQKHRTFTLVGNRALTDGRMEEFEHDDNVQTLIRSHRFGLLPMIRYLPENADKIKDAATTERRVALLQEKYGETMTSLILLKKILWDKDPLLLSKRRKEALLNSNQ